MREALLRPRTLGLVILAALLILFPFFHTWPFFGGFIGPFRTFQAASFAYWLVILLGMNLLTGYSGQVSLGHAALVAVGAYITAILFDQYSVPLGLAILMGGLVTGIMGGVIVGVPAVRLSGPYLAIATFSLIVALPQILKMDIEVAGLSIDVTQWTKGTRGISVGEINPPEVVDRLVDQRQWLYYMSVVPALIMTILAWNLNRSRIGRAFLAVRDSEIAAQQMGINVRLYKALAFGISSCFAGVGGGLFLMAQGVISPNSMDVLTSINFLIAIVIGGLATILGSIIGAIYLTFQGEIISNVAPEIARVVPEQLVQDPQTLRGVIFGSLLVIMIIFFPRGLAGAVHNLLRWSPARAGQPPDLRRWLASLQLARTFARSRGLKQAPDSEAGRRDDTLEGPDHADEGRG
jgi:branched-chain amino acid transport system permease protein